jgi:hypothetical protein
MVQSLHPLFVWNCGPKTQLGSDVFPLKLAMGDEESSHEIERPMREADVGTGCGDFAHHEIDELAGSKKFLGLGIFDVNVEGIFDSH